MTLRSLLIVLFALPVTACAAARDELGLTRRAPDEFTVVQRAPLEMPPDYYLRPPTPGAQRPQELTATNQAAQALLGRPANTAGPQSRAENVLLQKTNANAADPNIRGTINAETAEIAQDSKPTIKRILDIGNKDATGVAPVIDAPAEAARIKSNKQSGKAVNDGVTVPLER